MAEFGRATMSHCKREANFAAHELDGFGFIQRTGFSWKDWPPNFLVPTHVNDLIVI